MAIADIVMMTDGSRVLVLQRHAGGHLDLIQIGIMQSISPSRARAREAMAAFAVTALCRKGCKLVLNTFPLPEAAP